MRICTFRSFDDNQPRIIETDWQGFCSEVIGAKHKQFPGDKKKTPAFSPAEYPEGVTRGKASVRRVWLGVLDYDTLSWEELKQIYEALDGNRFLVYTSYSHVASSPRVRLVLDLDRPVTPAEWPHFWSKLAAALPGTADSKCKDPSRIYGLPYTPNLEDAAIDVFEGHPVSVDAVLGSDAGTDAAQSVSAADMERTQNLTSDDLKEYARRLSRKANPADATMGRWLLAVAQGEVYALPGSRHNTALDITRHLERAFPQVPIEILADLFQGSLRAMRAPDFEPAAEIVDIENALRGARESRFSRRAEAQRAEAETQTALIREAFRGARTEPYTEAEVRQFAAEAGVSVDSWKKRWIIQQGTSFYVFVGGGYQSPPLTKDSLQLSLQRDLAPAASVGVTLVKMDDLGKWVKKTREELLEQYATAARSGVASYLTAKSFYDAGTQTLHEAVCPPRTFEPEYSPEIDQWLHLLAGDRYADLNLWLKEAWDLTQPLAALYLEGDPGTGKSFFADLLARLFGVRGPVEVLAAVDQYNDMITQNPVVLADESVPPAWTQAGGLGRFRSFVAARERPLNRKYLSRIPLLGCVRLILTANNQDLIRVKESLTENDRSAIVGRIFHIHTPAEAASYLTSLGSKTNDWLGGDAFARHAAWVRENLTLIRQGRFGVAGHQSELHETMKQSQPINAALGEWLLGFLLEPERFWNANPKKNRNLARIEGGRLYVNVKAVNSQYNWSIYVSNPRDVPSSYMLGRALGELGPDRSNRKNIQYRIIDLDGLTSLALHSGLATVEEITQALAKAESADQKRLD